MRDPGDRAGRIRIAVTDLGSLSSDGLADLRRERVGIIFQSFHLLPSLSALNNAALPLQLARAVLELIVSLKRELGATLVLVTHDLDFAARCDRVLRLHEGQLRVTLEGCEASRRRALPFLLGLARPGGRRLWIFVACLVLGAADDAALTTRLGLKPGDRIEIGDLTLTVPALTVRQPDRSLRADWGAAPVLLQWRLDMSLASLYLSALSLGLGARYPLAQMRLNPAMLLRSGG